MESMYTRFVDSMSTRYPTLTALADFLKRGSQNPVHASSIRILDIDKNGAANQTRDMTLDELLYHLNNCATSEQVSGVVVLLEDPGPVYMEKLGVALDINPLFFGGHVVTAHEPVEKQTPPPIYAMFPSQIISQDFIHIHYQKVVDLGEERQLRGTPYKLIMPGNIPREVRQVQALSGRQLALVRTCTAVLFKRLSHSTWVSLMLVDSSTRDFVVDKRGYPGSTFDDLRVSPHRIPTEDIRTMPTYSSFTQGISNPGPKPASLLEYLVEIFKTASPRLQARSPNILSVAYYPLRIALEEWKLYCLLMSGYVKYYEYTFKNVHQRIGNAENQELLELHRWRRRSKQSVHKLQVLEGFVEYWQKDLAPCVETEHLLQDIQYIAHQIRSYSESLETKGPIITTMIQMLDARRSIEEAVNVRQLTYIALVFIPLSFVATIFSMGDEYGPGKKKFWVYFATAIPLAILILAASKLSTQLQVPWSLFRVHWNLEFGQWNQGELPV